MRNLEFKNPIQKFKEGRKIGKYKNPAGPIYSMVKPGNWMARTPIIGEDGQQTFTNSYVTPEKVVPQKDGRTIAKIKGKWYNQNGQLITNFVSHNSPATPQNTGTTPRTVSRPKVDYAANFAGMNFTDAEKDFITKAGFDPTNAKSVQEFILSRASNANLGARKGAGIADGYWGDKSAAAFQALRNQGIFAPKVDAQEPVKPVNTTPIDAPDFGYATNQDYSNGSQFKELGFNNYQGLLLYAQNSQDQFAKDLRQRFGNKLTNQNYVESKLGISGKYRGGSAGDFGDMARSMQEWKTGVNNDFDKKRADYAQARLAERTGSDGVVYSSPEMMRRFESIKVSPEVRFGGNRLDFSNMKYNLNFGNTGANTLGGIGTLGGGGLS